MSDDLVERLRVDEWSPGEFSEVGALRNEAADEIERLEAQCGRFYDTIVRLSVELDAAKAERSAGMDKLDEAHQITLNGLWRDIAELKASCTSLRETKDLFFRNAEAWEQRAGKLTAALATGTCPCCHRTFRQMALHMKNKHPDFKAETMQ